MGLNEASSWTLTVANQLQLADNGYGVEEVVVSGTSVTTVSELLVRTTMMDGTQTETVEYTRLRRTIVASEGVVTSDTRTTPEVVSAGDLSSETIALFTPDMRTQTTEVSTTEATTYALADAEYRGANTPDALGLSTRLLRIRRPDAAAGPALASRLVLTFDYRPAVGYFRLLQPHRPHRR